MRETHALSRIGLALIGAGLLITLVFSVGFKCLEPRFEEMPRTVSVQAIRLVYRPLGIFICALGTAIVLATTVLTDDDDLQQGNFLCLRRLLRSHLPGSIVNSLG